MTDAENLAISKGYDENAADNVVSTALHVNTQATHGAGSEPQADEDSGEQPYIISAKKSGGVDTGLATATIPTTDSKRALGRLSVPPRASDAKRPRRLKFAQIDSHGSIWDAAAASDEAAAEAEASEDTEVPPSGQVDPQPRDVVLRIEFADSGEMKLVAGLMVGTLLAGVAVTAYFKVSAQQSGSSWYLLRSREAPNFRDNFIAGLICTALPALLGALYLGRGAWFVLRRRRWDPRRFRIYLSRLAELVATGLSMAAWTYAGSERRLQSDCRSFHSTLLWTYAIRLTCANCLLAIWTLAARGMTVHRGGPMSLHRRLAMALRHRLAHCCGGFLGAARRLGAAHSNGSSQMLGSGLGSGAVAVAMSPAAATGIFAGGSSSTLVAAKAVLGTFAAAAAAEGGTHNGASGGGAVEGRCVDVRPAPPEPELLKAVDAGSGAGVRPGWAAAAGASPWGAPSAARAEAAVPSSGSPAGSSVVIHGSAEDDLITGTHPHPLKPPAAAVDVAAVDVAAVAPAAAQAVYPAVKVASRVPVSAFAAAAAGPSFAPPPPPRRRSRLGLRAAPGGKCGGGYSGGAGPESSRALAAASLAAAHVGDEEHLYIDAPWWDYLGPLLWLWVPFQCMVGVNTAFLASRDLASNGGTDEDRGVGDTACMELYMECRSFDQGSLISLGVLLAAEVVYVVIYFGFCLRAFAYLRSRSYVLFRQLNIYLSVEVRIRGLALVFLVANDFVQALIVPRRLSPGGAPLHCRFSLDTVLGLWSTQVVTTVVVCVVAWMYIPRSVLGDLPLMQASLQRFAWTERDLPRQRALRLASLPPDHRRIAQLEREPMFCFETAVKLTYWCEHAYYYEEPGCEMRLPLSKLMELYDMENIVVQRNEDSDAKVMIAWTWERCLLCFRGTASLKAACVDLKAMLVPYYQSSYWRQHHAVAALATVHAGFQWSWTHGGFHRRVLDWVRGYRGRHPHGKIIVTGHSLGGAHAVLCALDLVRELGEGLPYNHLTCYTFGAPRVGNHAFARLYDKAVAETWHVVNCNDMVPLTPKYVGWFVYKHPGHRVVVKRRGDLLVRPTFTENTVARMPWARSLRQHLLGSYLRSLMAVLRSQTRGKHIEGGVRGLMYLARYRLPEVDSVLRELVAEVTQVAAAAAAAGATGAAAVAAATGASDSGTCGWGDARFAAAAAAAGGGVTAQQAAVAAALAAARVGPMGHKVFHFMARHNSLRLLLEDPLPGASAPSHAAAEAAPEPSADADPHRLPHRTPARDPLHARQLLLGLVRQLDLGMQLLGLETGIDEGEEEDGAGGGGGGGAQGDGAAGARGEDGRGGLPAKDAAAPRAACDAELAAFERAEAGRTAAQARYRQRKILRARERRAAAGGGRWVSKVAAAAAARFHRVTAAAASAGGGPHRQGLGPGVPGAGGGLRCATTQQVPQPLRSMTSGAAISGGGGGGGTGGLELGSGRGRGNVSGGGGGNGGVSDGSGARRRKVRAARRSGRELLTQASASPLPGRGQGAAGSTASGSGALRTAAALPPGADVGPGAPSDEAAAGGAAAPGPSTPPAAAQSRTAIARGGPALDVAAARAAAGETERVAEPGL